jgi:hypothetical protein
MSRRDSIAGSDAEQLARVANQQVDEQQQQDRDEPAADDEELPVYLDHLLLARDGALLEIERALGDAAILSQVLALSIESRLQEPADLVSVQGSLRSLPTGALAS